MKNKLFIIQAFIFLAITGFISCNNDDDNSPLVVETVNTINLSYTSVTVVGEVMQGSASQRGICWNTSGNPTVNDSKMESGSGKGIFSVNITDLKEGTVYYFRAYATSGSGVEYGEEKNVLTYEKGIPAVGILSFQDITFSSITCDVRVVTDGGTDVIKRGVCWSTTPNPTLESSFSDNGSGTGTFTSVMAGLKPETTYYVRPYATYAGGTAYGVQMEMTTKTVLSLKLNDVATTGSFSVAGIFVSELATTEVTIQEQGVIWSETTDPTIETGTIVQLSDNTAGEYPIAINGLECEQTYYIRAYCKIDNTIYYTTTTSFTTTVSYDYYLGDWTMSFNTVANNPDAARSTIDITIEPNEEGTSYYIKGWLKESIEKDGVNIVMNYDSSTKGLALNGQVCRSDDTFDYWLIATNNGSASGSFSANSTFGLISQKIQGESIAVNMIHNGKWSSTTIGLKLSIKYDKGTVSGNKGTSIDGNGGNGYNYFYIILTKK